MKKRRRGTKGSGRGRDETRQERRLRGIATLEVQMTAPKDRWERNRGPVLEMFARKARAAGLSGADVEHLGPRILVHDVRAGRYVTTPSDTPSFVSVVGAGAVKTIIPTGIIEPNGTRRWLTVQFAKPGYVVGLTPIAQYRASRKFGAIAHCDSVVAEIDRDVILDVLHRATPRQRLTMFAYHCRVLSRLIASKCELLPLSISDRLRHVLPELARNFPLPGEPGAINLTLRHRDLAEYVGTTRTVVVRAMKQLGDVLRFDRALRRYVVQEALLEPMRASGLEVDQRARGLRADDSERLLFQKRLRWAMHNMRLPQAVVELLRDGAELRSFAPGDVIAVDDRLYASVLVSGAGRVLVRTSSRDVGVWIAKPGHFIGAGWISGAGSSAPEFRAVAHDAGAGNFCQVAFLKEDLLLEAMAAFEPALLLSFLTYCHDALSRQLYDRTVLLSLRNCSRLLYQLHVLARDFPEPAADGTIIDVPLDFVRDLAPLIATDRWGIYRAKHDLEAAGRIRILDDGRVLVVGLHVTLSVA